MAVLTKRRPAPVNTRRGRTLKPTRPAWAQGPMAKLQQRGQRYQKSKVLPRSKPPTRLPLGLRLRGQDIPGPAPTEQELKDAAWLAHTNPNPQFLAGGLEGTGGGIKVHPTPTERPTKRQILPPEGFKPRAIPPSKRQILPPEGFKPRAPVNKAGLASRRLGQTGIMHRVPKRAAGTKVTGRANALQRGRGRKLGLYQTSRQMTTPKMPNT